MVRVVCEIGLGSSRGKGKLEEGYLGRPGTRGKEHEFLRGHGIHTVVGRRITGAAGGHSVLPGAVSFKSRYTIQHYKSKPIIESYMFTFR